MKNMFPDIFASVADAAQACVNYVQNDGFSQNHRTFLARKSGVQVEIIDRNTGAVACDPGHGQSGIAFSG